MNRIKELLNEKGLTQTELANRLNISKASITQLLTIANPRLETLESVAKVLNVPVWELLISRENMQNEFTPDVFGIVRVEGAVFHIESAEDLERLGMRIKGEHKDILSETEKEGINL